MDGQWRRELTLDLPDGTPVLFLAFPLDSGLRAVRVNGELALDAALETKRERTRYGLRIVNPPQRTLTVELLGGRATSFRMAAVTWQPLPDVLVAPFKGYWPDEAQPYYFGPRAEKIQEFEIR